LRPAHLGIPQPVLSRFENGVSVPDDALLLKASQVYQVPKTFFEILDPVYGPPVSVHPMLRGKADVTTRDLEMITAEMNIRVMHLRRFLDSVDFEPTNNLPVLDVETALPTGLRQQSGHIGECHPALSRT
jgi:transcriptional regulator with XRE-family HTH domain